MTTRLSTDQKLAVCTAALKLLPTASSYTQRAISALNAEGDLVFYLDPSARTRSLVGALVAAGAAVVPTPAATDDAHPAKFVMQDALDLLDDMQAGRRDGQDLTYPAVILFLQNAIKASGGTV